MKTKILYMLFIVSLILAACCAGYFLIRQFFGRNFANLSLMFLDKIYECQLIENPTIRLQSRPDIYVGAAL